MYREYNSLLGVSSSGLGVGDAPRSALCLLAWWGAGLARRPLGARPDPTDERACCRG